MPEWAHNSDPATPAPGARPAPKPAAPAKDYGKGSWGEAFAQGVRTAPQVVQGWGTGLLNAAQQAPGAALGFARGLGTTGTGSTLSTASQPDMTMATDLINMMTGSHRPTHSPLQNQAVGLYNRYGSPEAFKRTIASDLPGAGLDASALLGLPELAEARVAAMAPSALRSAAMTGIQGAKVASRLTNPVHLAGAVPKSIAAVARPSLRLAGPVLDATGNFTPAALKATDAANISRADLANPDFKKVVADRLQKSGNTPAAAKQAVLEYHGAPAPRPTVTQRPPPGKPGDFIPAQVDTAKQTAHDAINSKVDDMVGPGAPSSGPYPSAVDAWKSGRQAAVKSVAPDGTAAFDPAKTREMLADPSHPDRPLFNDRELSDLNIAANGKAILDAPPELGSMPESPSWIARGLRGAATAGAGAALGGGLNLMGVSDLAHSLGGDWLLPAATSAAGTVAEQFFENHLAQNARAAQVAGGAPVAGGFMHPVADYANAMAAGAQPAAFAHASGLMPAPTYRPTPTLAAPAAPAPTESAAPAQPPPDLSGLPGPDAGAPPPKPAQGEDPNASWLGAGAPAASAAAPAPAPAPEGGTDLSTLPGPDDEPRKHHADGGRVLSMVDRLMTRAEREGKATRSATKPLLGLDDTTVAKALAIAGRAI